MDVLILLIFVSLVLVAASLLFLLVRIRGGDFEHLDRLPFLPLEPDGRGGPDADPGAAPPNAFRLARRGDPHAVPDVPSSAKSRAPR